MTKTIMLVHGAWLTPLAWAPFKARYEAQGYTVLAPAWPMDERPVPELRRAPHPGLKRLGLKAIVDHYAALVEALPEAPILIGHSFGGLIVQLLMDRGLGAAGVAIDPGVPRGVLPGLGALRSAAPVLLAWNGWNRVLTMSLAGFRRDFAQTLPEAEALAAFEKHIVPTPGRIYFQGAFGIGTGVNWKNPKRGPLLLIAGEKDRTVDSSMVRAAYRKHQAAPAATAFKEFPGRSHWLIAGAGWEEVADYSLSWVKEHLTGERPKA
jgi:pimeloyl-ACP methyl ester carboxylesterase